MSIAVRHFLNLLDCSATELHQLIDHAIAVKQRYKQGETYQPLLGKVLAMIFEKSSTRTRISFETAMYHLGGNAIFLSPKDTQLGRGEPIEDTARVTSSMVDCVMVRTFEHERIESFAAHSSVPVINGLTDRFHPCQLLADIQTFIELRGSVAGKKIAWIGDSNNVCYSFVLAAKQFGFELRIAAPEGYQPDPEFLSQHGDNVALLTTDPKAAAKDADLINTDVWASMGQEEEQRRREQAFQGYQVDAGMMALAASDALFMHCLPAHRGEEVSAEVIDGSQSAVWQQAENRLHAQKALLEMLLVGLP